MERTVYVCDDCDKHLETAEERVREYFHDSEHRHIPTGRVFCWPCAIDRVPALAARVAGKAFDPV